MVSFCVPVTANALAGGKRISHYDRHVTIGPSTGFLSVLNPYCSELGGFALTLALHTQIDRLVILFREHHTADAHVDNVYAKLLRSQFQLFHDSRHGAGSVATNNINGSCTQYAAD